MSKVESYLLGMDCGTTNLKAIILGEDGTVVAEASRPSTFMDLKSDMREQDANEWWNNTVEIFKSLVEQAGYDIVKRIRGISRAGSGSRAGTAGKLCWIRDMKKARRRIRWIWMRS